MQSRVKWQKMAEAQVAESKTIAAMPEPLMERVMAVYRHETHETT